VEPHLLIEPKFDWSQARLIFEQINPSCNILTTVAWIRSNY